MWMNVIWMKRTIIISLFKEIKLIIIAFNLENTLFKELLEYKLIKYKNKQCP